MFRARFVAVLALVFVCGVCPLASMQSGRRIYRIGEEGVSPPRLVFKQEPSYTPEAREAKVEGSVLLSGVVDVDGKVHEIKVMRGLEPSLDTNAVKAVETWRFEPAQKGGQPVPVAARIEVNFRLL